MKTLKEWFDGLSEQTRELVQRRCENWIDVNEPTYYKEYVSSVPYMLDNHDSYSRADIKGAFARDAITDYVAATDDVNIKWLVDIINNAEIQTILALRQKMKLEKFNELMTKVLECEAPNIQLALSTLLAITPDYGNIQISGLKTYMLDKGFMLSTEFTEIFGKDVALSLIHKDPSVLAANEVSADLFDEVFFSDEFTQEHQRKVIANKYSDCNLVDLADFMERLVAVDTKYLYYLGRIMRKTPALAAHAYNEKKPAHELTGLETIEQRYRYPKHIRKLFHIAACCARKHIGKAMTGTVGDVAAILKMYSYDWNMIFGSMYPEESRRIQEHTLA